MEQKMKSIRFGKAIESLRRYVDIQEKLMNEGKISEVEYARRIASRAELLDL